MYIQIFLPLHCNPPSHSRSLSPTTLPGSSPPFLSCRHFPARIAPPSGRDHTALILGRQIELRPHAYHQEVLGRCVTFGCMASLLSPVFLRPFRCAADDGGDERRHSSSSPPSFPFSLPALPLSPLFPLLHPPVTNKYPQGDSQAHPPPSGLSFPPSISVRSGLDRQMHLPSLHATATTENGGSDGGARSAGGRKGGREGGEGGRGGSCVLFLLLFAIGGSEAAWGSTQTPSVIHMDEEGPCWGDSETTAM